jgi:GT2 family glycosyltransferase
MSAALLRDQPLNLSISLVCYKSDPALLLCTLNSLHVALLHTQAQQPITAQLTLVDNGNDAELLHQLLQQSSLDSVAEIICNQHNPGFGSANNQVIDNTASEYHLILNPDVELQNDALQVALSYLQQNPRTVAISPACHNGSGATEYLCKRYPGLFILLLRGFAPEWLKRRFHTALSHYQYQELASSTAPTKVELISGCFMLCRTQPLQQVGGFDEAYFLYFEDFALSIALARIGDLYYLPACRIVHHGGNAANKGLRHIRHFIRSAWHFYQCHGWKLW